MPQFVIEEAEVPSIKTERDAFFEQKRIELRTHRGRTRLSWHLTFIRKNKETVSCRGMHVEMVLHQLESLQHHFDNDTISRYIIMCAGLRTVISSPEDPLQETAATAYRAPCARCTICNRKGVPYNVCLSCGEDSGGLYL